MIATAAFIATLFAQGGLGPPQNAQAAPPAGTATVRGHVTAADTGLPLRKAQVRIVANEIRENRLATTDENGAYEFTDVRPARYTISASKGSYVTLAYGQSRSTDPPKPIEILDRQTVERLDVMLPRGGIIAGRIMDDSGEPLSDVQVSAQQYRFIQGRRTLIPARVAMTNDLGEFRLFGIAPGQYYLQATWRNQMGPNPDTGPAARLTFAPTFFPGTTASTDAQRLTLTAGREITDVVMVLRAIRAVRVTGTAAGADGNPLTPAMIMAMRASGMGVDIAASAQVHGDGTFTINALPPGDYNLRAQRMGGTPGDGPEVASATITVGDEDLSNVRLEAFKPSAASGRVVVDPALVSQLPKTISLAFFPPVFNGMPAPPPPPVTVGADDLTFTVKAPPGVFRVSLGGFGAPPPGWAIKSVRLNGSDVTDAIEFKPNEDISGLEVELTNKIATVSGLVSTRSGDAIKDYTVIVFAQDKEKWTGNSRYQAIGRPDQDGRFKTGNLPAGDYYIIALDRVESGQWSDPDFLESIRMRASTFSLMDGETKIVDVKLTTMQ